ncbi:caspase family protein [Streptomyces sp. NPDC051976]|uniref:caspase family protein n=1 Tax=Streptomyces sp. NPDC051976 TaxID=3154947 RepID=UPI00341D587D
MGESQSRHALIIANDRYDDGGFKKLRAPAQDATALAEVLHDPEVGDFEVDVVHNAPADQMRRRIQGFFNDRRRDDTMLLHFSCHGIKSESGELYFAATDTEPQMLDATAVPAQFVRQCMSRTRARSTVLFLDCCYGGAFSRGASVRAAGDVNVLESFEDTNLPGAQGWAVITASNSMEYAFEGSDLAENSAPQPSLFTHAVVQGLETGEADLDADGEIGLNELYDYVFDHVRGQNPNQTPSRTVEMQGELHLAHNRRSRIKIAAIPSPPSLRSAIGSDNAFTRQGAVLELRSRLSNDSLAVAEGARQDLEEVARNDIRQIADEASRALREIHLAPSPDHLDFGKVLRGAALESRPVTLSGPPLARHCVAQSTQSWLRVEPSTTGLNVRVETYAEGRLSGDVVLKGVADEAQIHVEVLVEPTPEREPGIAPEPGPASASAKTAPKPAPKPAKDEDTVVVHPPSERRHGPSRPPKAAAVTDAGTEEPRTPVTRSAHSRAAAFAAAALALVLTALITVILAAEAGVAAVSDRKDAGVTGHDIEFFVHQHGALTPLVVSLVTAAAALVFGALARHEVRAPRPGFAAHVPAFTRPLISVTKGVAIAVLALGVIMLLAYLIGSHWW